ncbi:BppU family phage baseplate upper protein [Lacrimispora defluvii]|uniref:BppU family phage baseplate upper protein n=1 Tax=Lacrimispora defluvii TaxID=2719233 RepID=A0ABX1VZ27_9FIRM|nr:BppU family phage baseplate upper protein [Lacrimispora defluvii]NNJ32451.1 BppU family phage baseplate upper protein [Lacrimispora defluvii]
MNYDIELNANDSSVLETQYVFTQGDYGQIQFSIRVKVNGSYVTNAQRAYIVFTLPNGYVVTGADMSKSVATYTYPFQGNELQVPGTILADVKLVYTDGQISSNKFSFICRYDPLHDKSFNAGPYISQLQQIVDEGQTKIDYLQSLIEILQGEVGATGLTKNDLQSTRNPVATGLKAIDAYLAQYMLVKNDLINNFLTTVAGVAPLDAAAGKILNDKIGDTSNLPSGINDLVSAVAQTNSNLNGLNDELNNKLPAGSLHLKVTGNLGHTQIIKNSSSSADYGTIIANYMQDGSITEIILSDTGLNAAKVDSGGNIISNKPIVTF